MQIQYTFKHLESTEAIKGYAATRIEKMEKFSLHKEEKVHFIFSVQKKGDQVAEVTMDVGPYHFEARAHETTLYAAIDAVVDKLERQLSKQKEKTTDHKHKAGVAMATPPMARKA